jgi:hypothetical protein
LAPCRWQKSKASLWCLPWDLWPLIFKSRLVHTSTFKTMNNQQQINSIGFTITYQIPYNNCEWRTQSFATKEEAERMISFYQSCGSPARFV